ncbi:hypothetical protein [Dongia rigui]|nr:hypothetical protein [Dongia rigui]
MGLVFPIDRRSLARWLGLTVDNLWPAITQPKALGVEVSARHARVADVGTLRALNADADRRWCGDITKDNRPDS